MARRKKASPKSIARIPKMSKKLPKMSKKKFKSQGLPPADALRF